MDDAEVNKKGDARQITTRLECAATNTAQFLCATMQEYSHFSEAKTTRELVRGLFALAGALRGLNEALIESGEPRAWTLEHGERLLHSLEECGTIVETINRQALKSNEVPKTSAEQKSEKESIEGVVDEKRDWASVLDKCFQLVTLSTLVARHPTPARKECLDDEEIPETLRHDGVNVHTVLEEVRAFNNKSAASKRLQEDCVPMISTNHPISQPGDSAVAAPSAQAEKLASTVPTSTSTHSITTTPETVRASASTLPGVLGTFESTQAPPTKVPAQAEPRAVSFGQPSIVKPSSDSSSLFGGGSFATFPKHDQRTSNPFAPASHLEGYVLRPTVQNSDVASTLSYCIDSLPLGNDTLQAYVYKLGADYSVMDAILDLQPQQSNLIQLRARDRQGSIMSIQHGRPFDLSTLMGPLQVKSIAFIISTTNMWPLGKFGASVPLPIVPNSTRTSDWGLPAGPVPTTGFGSNTGFRLDPNRNYNSPEAYSQHLKEQGEPCTYVEGSERKGEFTHFETITMNDEWHDKDRSLEEIRLADYDAGRTGPIAQKPSGVTYPWDRTQGVSAGPWRIGGPKAAPPNEAKVTQTSCFPSTAPPTSSSAFGIPEPRKFFCGGVVNGILNPPLPVPSLTTQTNPPISPNGVPFARVAPDLPPFVPPGAPQPAAAGRNLFGGPPSLPKEFCTVQHTHGLLCRGPPLSGHQRSRDGDDATFPHQESAPKGPALFTSSLNLPSRPQSSPGVSLFGGTPSVRASENTPLNSRTSALNQPFRIIPTDQPPTGGLFGRNTTTSGNPFAASSQPSLSTAPAPSQRPGGLFGSTPTTAATPSPSQSGLEDQKPLPPVLDK